MAKEDPFNRPLIQDEDELEEVDNEEAVITIIVDEEIHKLTINQGLELATNILIQVRCYDDGS